MQGFLLCSGSEVDIQLIQDLPAVRFYKAEIKLVDFCLSEDQ